ncbi:MAG: PSD1 and planctomycete cytochrome C domain-containing protein [Bryobacteraceae bacterium]
MRVFVLSVIAMADALDAQPQAAWGILEKQCLPCHGAAAMSNLDLRTRESALKGGKRGAALMPGQSAQSLLLKAVARQGELSMPPGNKALDAAQVEALRAWIDRGAAWPDGPEKPEKWWAFRKTQRPAVPPGATHPVDAFLLEKLQEKRLTPVGLADRRTLIRRAYADLHGLPPEPKEVDAFVQDSSPDAWEKLIDRLLESPRYGERWGRHWLDVVRYADTGGFETDIYFPNAWRYRDYVIQSFNADKPYNRFVEEQIAGDEMFADNLDLNGGFDIPKDKLAALDARIATGLYTIGPVYHEAALFGDQVRYEWLTDAVDTTGEAFLGLTLGCSRCHDHKFDPLTRRDYHRLMAIFAASDEREIPVVSKFSVFGFKSGYPSYLQVEEIKGAIQRIEQAARSRVVRKVRDRFPAEVNAAYDVPAEKRSVEQRRLAAQLEKTMTEAGLQENAEGKVADIPYTTEEHEQRERLIYQLGQAALKVNPVAPTATVLGAADKIPDVHLTNRGDWRSKGEVMSPGFPAALSRSPDVSTPQRRKALAEWLTDPDHPLTARVFVNRVWHWHFARGIVGTPNDFGRQGEEPTHPELLEWLTREFIDKGWQVKKLHRLIMTSQAYCRASSHDASNAAIDAGNRFLWRGNRRRLDAESLRDFVLAAAGTLNLKMGGRPVIPPLSQEEYSSMWARNQWPESMDSREHARRSVYLYVKRTFPLPMLQTFDSPDTSTSCARRDSTTVAPQALTLMNSGFMFDQARQFAVRIGKDSDPIDGLWRIAYGREPAADERAKARRFLDSGGPDALARLCLVTFNTNEFLYVD